MYAIGQKFEDSYPPEAAMWCNENGGVIVQVEGGFEIHTSPEPLPADTSSVVITSDNITIADAELLMDAANAGEKTAIWLINKLEL